MLNVEMEVSLLNEQNLKPVRSESEAREKGAKGGKASGAARRKKRDAKEAAILLLNLAVTDKLDKYLEELNVKEQDRTNLVAIIARHVLQAQSGNINSARLVLETAGYLQKNSQDNNLNVNIGKNGKGENNIVVYLPDKEELE